jgi:hypothetical protein
MKGGEVILWYRCYEGERLVKKWSGWDLNKNFFHQS